MRRRDVSNKQAVYEVVKELDAFPKIPVGYKETSASGGGMLVFIAIAILVASEVRYYTASEMVYSYAVDSEFNGKLKINVDMTVAMKCNQIGADVLDLTGQSAATFGKLEEEDTHFELSPNQRVYFDMVTNMNEYIRDEYHAVHEFLWKSGYTSMGNNMPKRENTPSTPPDACRLHGSLEVNKVAGNFHITAGKSVPVIPSGHAHLTMFLSEKDYNFTHRINLFSFGDQTPGIINPLDGEEKMTYENYHIYQYFIQVVPTKVYNYFSSLDTFQYAVTEQNRNINHSKGSHGVPGIFVKYDLSSLQVTVTESHKPYSQFLIRMCGIIGGIFTTSGIIHRIISLLTDVVCCRYRWGKYKPMLPVNQSVSKTASLDTATSDSAQPIHMSNPILSSQTSENGTYHQDSPSAAQTFSSDKVVNLVPPDYNSESQ